MSKRTWLLNRQSATLEADGWTATLDLSNPSAGLHVSGDLAAQRLFALLIDVDPVDSFVRDSDLVVRYPPRNSDLVSYETYFRVMENGKGLQMILSAQTNLLESKPETKVTASFELASIIQQTASMEPHAGFETNSDDAVRYFLVRPTDASEHSILVMAHPSDYYRAAFEPESSQIAFWVFPDSLEKGVIRRARFQVRLLDRANDEIEAAEVFASAREEAPPLAT